MRYLTAIILLAIAASTSRAFQRVPFDFEGEDVGYQMLVAFAGDRDYAKAEKLAKLVGKTHPLFPYASRLIEELPKRRDDFGKLKLPTPMEWTELKKKMTRTEQIDFLCQRYRLLNYFQFKQPGGYMPGSPQYAEPCGMKSNATWGLGKGKTEVINPETELAGSSWSRLFDLEDEEKPRGLALTMKDVPQLSKHLRDDWLMPTVTFWRDFSSGRSVSSTRPLFADLINEIACRDICNVKEWDKLKPAEIDKEIERINKWATANANKSTIDLKWDALDEAVAAGKGWYGDVAFQVRWLLNKKDKKAYFVMKRLLEHEKTDDFERSQILRTFLEHDPNEAKDIAPKYLDDKHEETQFVAAMIVFQSGDKGKSRKILGQGIESRWPDWLTKGAVDMLLKDGSQDSRRQATRLFKKKELNKGDLSELRAEMMRTFADARIRDPYAYYLNQLDNTEVATVSWTDRDSKVTRTTYAEVHAREIIYWFGVKDPEVIRIRKEITMESNQIQALKKWLQAKISAK